jgi:hypothetical protein
MTRSRRSSSHQTATIKIHLSGSDLDLLVRLADFHLKSMGSMRHLVRLTGSSEIRTRFRFVQEESKWLRKFSEAEQAKLADSGNSSIDVGFTPRTLIACWGRVLASLNKPRSRRKLSSRDVEVREALAEKLRQGALVLRQRSQKVLNDELDTRKPEEAAWMRASLEPEDVLEA